MRRHYLGDRGENENDIQQSENDLTGENNQEEKTDEENVPPLEDIDESESEEEKEEDEIIVPETNIVEIEKTKEDDIGKFSSIKRFFSSNIIFYLSDIPFIRPPLQNVLMRSSSDTIFGELQSRLTCFII